MEVKLKRVVSRLKQVRDVNFGDCFVYQNKVYLRTNGSYPNSYTSVRLEDGILRGLWFERVEPITIKAVEVKSD